MLILFVILVVIVSVALGLIVLVQNPKGGGLAGNIAGFSTQFMGVKQTTDVLEKGTWIFAGVIGALCIVSTFFIAGGGGTNSNLDKVQGSSVPGATTPAPGTQQATPENTTVFPQATPADSTN